MDLSSARLWTAGLVCAVAAVMDWRERRIPNWLCFGGLLAGFAMNDWGFALKGLALALAIHLPLFALRATGGGDVKLMGALGAMLGLDDWLRLFIISALLGGVVAIGFVLSRGVLRDTIRRIGFILSSLVRGRAPYQAKPELDVGSGMGRTLPRGVIVGIAYLGWILWR